MTGKAASKQTPTPEQKQAADPQHSVWVAANAGSGKTQVLVDRVLRLLLAGADPQAILCLTFTKAAAAEMSNRLFKRLGEWVALSDAELDTELTRLGEAKVTMKIRAEARKLFARALETPGGLRIQTIHAFCERLLQLFPVESGLAPGFRIMDDLEQQALEETAYREALLDPQDGVSAGWAFLRNGDFANLQALIKAGREFLADRGDLQQKLTEPGFLSQLEDRLKQVFGVADQRSIEALDAELLTIDVGSYEQALRCFQSYGTYNDRDLPALLQNVIRGPVSLLSLSDLFLTQSGTPVKKLVSKDAAKTFPQQFAWLTSEQGRVADLLAKRALRQIVDATTLVTTALTGVQLRILDEKRRRGLYDFDDLIARTAQLLSQAESAQWVLRKLDAGLSHILVDEAQDTSPAQWKIIKALADEFFAGDSALHPQQRTIFAVGDAKQSIFSFQGADTAAFGQARRAFEKAAQDKFKSVDLTISYRSTKEVLDAVDRTFAEGSPARAGYGTAASAEAGHTAKRDKERGLVEVWDALSGHSEEPDYWKAPVDHVPDANPHVQLAKLIARQVKSWLGRRLNVATGQPVQPQDILILVQRRSGLVFQNLIAELRRADVPVAGADRLVLQDSLIVKDLLALGQCLRLPQDDYALACVLKSPLVPQPMNDDGLLHLAHREDGESLWQRLKADPDAQENAFYLSGLATFAKTSGPFAFFSKVTQARMCAIRERLGSEAEDAVSEFLSLAMEHEMSRDLSIAGFLEQLKRSEIEIKREMEEASGEVRIMTVHGAKGLEAPIVIMADAAYVRDWNMDNRVVRLPDDAGVLAGFPLFIPKTVVTPDIVERLKENAKAKQAAERFRLLYVAMTRARDELYVFGSYGKQKPRESSWHSIISNALEDAAATGAAWHIDIAGNSVLRLGADPQWLDENASAHVQGTEKELPTWVKTPLPLPPANQRLARSSDRSEDTEAQRHGVSVHRLMQLVADLPPHERLVAARRWQAKFMLHDLESEKLVALMDLPDWQIFFGPESQGEVQLRGKLPDGQVVDNRIDRLADKDGVFYLLDYKSGPPQQLSPGHAYVQQMARYRALLQTAKPGQEVKAALLWTQNARVEWLSPDLLSLAAVTGS